MTRTLVIIELYSIRATIPLNNCLAIDLRNMALCNGTAKRKDEKKKYAHVREYKYTHLNPNDQYWKFIAYTQTIQFGKTMWSNTEGSWLQILHIKKIIIQIMWKKNEKKYAYFFFVSVVVRKIL